MVMKMSFTNRIIVINSKRIGRNQYGESVKRGELLKVGWHGFIFLLIHVLPGLVKSGTCSVVPNMLISPAGFTQSLLLA